MTFMNSIRTHKVRAIKTLAVVIAFIPYGIAGGIIGPALLDLSLLTHSSLDKVSYLYPAKSLGNIVAKLIGELVFIHAFPKYLFSNNGVSVGFVYPHVNFLLMMAILYIFYGVSHFWVPFSSTYTLLVVGFTAIGFIGGLISTSSNIFMLELWGKENPPFFQVLQFAYGLGAFSAPLIVRPFILNVVDQGEDKPSTVNMTNLTYNKFDDSDLKIQYPFWIATAIMMIPSVFYFILWRLHPVCKPHPSRMMGINSGSNNNVSSEKSEETDNGHETDGSSSSTVQLNNPDQESSHYLTWKYIAIGLMCFFMLIYYGLELTYGQYLTSFSVLSDLHLPKTTGAEITSVYWAMFTFIRLLTAFYIGYIGSEINLFIDIAFILIANCFLIPFGYRYEWCLWVGSVIMGIGCSSIFGSAFGYLEGYFPLNSRIGSMIAMSLSAGEFVFPLILSQYFKTNPNIFLVVTLFCSLSMTLIFPLVVWVCKTKLRSNKR